MFTKIIFIALLAGYAAAVADSFTDECPSRYDIAYPGVTVSPRNASICANTTECACLSGTYQGYSFVVSDCSDYLQETISSLLTGVDVDELCKTQNKCVSPYFGLNVSCLYSTSECPTACDPIATSTLIPTTTVLPTTTHNSGLTYDFTVPSITLFVCATYLKVIL